MATHANQVSLRDTHVGHTPAATPFTPHRGLRAATRRRSAIQWGVVEASEVVEMVDGNRRRGTGCGECDRDHHRTATEAGRCEYPGRHRHSDWRIDRSLDSYTDSCAYGCPNSGADVCPYRGSHRETDGAADAETDSTTHTASDTSTHAPANASPQHMRGAAESLGIQLLRRGVDIFAADELLRLFQLHPVLLGIDQRLCR